MRPRVITLCPLLLAACTLAKMPVRPELAAGALEPFNQPVFDDGGKLQFGPFHLGSFDRSSIEESRSFTSGGLFPEWIKGMGELSAKQDFSFVLLERETALRTVRCRAAVAASSTRLAHGLTMSDAQQTLRCGLLNTSGSGELGRLELVSAAGTLQVGGRTVAIEARDIQGNATQFSPAGFVLHEGSRDLAAAMTVNGGAAWIAPGLDAESRALAAAATAALLLYRPLGEH